MDLFVQDLRYAVRRLRQAPGFTFVAVLIIGLGIGANTAIFSIVNAVLLRPQPFAQPDRLVNVYVSGSNGSAAATTSYPEYRALRERTDLFSGVASFDLQMASRATAEGSETAFVEVVSANYWDVLGLTPSRGRGFRADEDRPGSSVVAVMGYQMWERRFGADPGVVGSTVRLDGVPVTIVGIGPRNYRGVVGALTTEFWIPTGSMAALTPELEGQLERRDMRSAWVRARLQPGVTVERARAGVEVLMAALAREFPASNAGRTALVVPAAGVRIYPAVDRALYPIAALLLVVVGLVLAIACSNLANLLLARATARQKEVALRLALGSSRGRLVRQLVTESGLLGLLGGALGLGLAALLVRAIVSFQPPIAVPLALDLHLDGRVLAFTAALALGTGLLFGLAPALKATRPDLVRGLRDEEHTVALGDHRFGLRNVLVVLQVAGSVVLLIGAGLFVRSLGHAQQIDPGFERDRAAILTVNLGLGRMDSTRARQLLHDFADRIAATPGVRQVALTDRVPLGFTVRTREITIPGVEPPAGHDALEVDYGVVGPGYFRTLGIPLVRGRGFEPADDQSSATVVVVSEAMARAYWGTVDVIGRRLRLDGATGPALEIVGVARDTKVRTLGEQPRPYLYGAFEQQYDDLVAVVAATDGDPTPVVDRMRREFRAAYPDVPIFDAQTMAEHLGLMLFLPRMAAGLLSIFGLLAVGLAAVGLYGVVAFAVARRTREIGVRIALGAASGQVMRLVLGRSMALVGVGLGVGLVLALVAARLLAGALYGLSPSDPIAIGGTIGFLALVAVLASYLPARRAARVDPLVAIKGE